MIAGNDQDSIGVAPQTIDDYVIGKGRVLIMDDEEMPRIVMTRMLQKLGYTDITKTVRGEEAAAAYISAMQITPYDLAVLDLTITDGIDGVDTAKEISWYDPKAKARLVACSGYSDRAEEVMTYFGHFLSKPYSIEELKEILVKVKRSLEEPKPQE